MAEPLPLDDDSRLVLEHRAGRADAFDELYERFFPRLRGYCARITAPQVADDLAQEALVRALEHLARFDTRRPLWPWLKTIAANLAIDVARKGSRESAPLPDGDRPQWDDHSAILERPLLAAAMRSLTPSQQAAIRLRYLEDRDPSEAAAVLGLTAPAFKQLLYRARIRLRVEYERLVDGVLVLIPIRPMRRLIGDLWSRVRQLGARVGGSGVSAENVHQLTVGLVAAIVLVAGTPHLREPEGVGHLAAPDPRVATELQSADPQDRGERPPDPVAEPPAGTPPSGSTPSSGVAQEESSDAPVQEVIEDKVQDLTDPNAGTEQPEDTRLLSFAGPASGNEVYASGTGRCNETLCHPVLFRSTDGGHSWERLPATGLVADQMLLPPEYGQRDQRIFAMGAEGLLVSHDGGASFQPLGVGRGPHAAGPSAISPAFHEGDPTILIGGQTLARYRDDTQMTEPTRTSLPPGRYEPTYSPAFTEDQTVFLGGNPPDPNTGTYAATVYRCVGSTCSGVALPDEGVQPKVRTGPDYAVTGRVFAFTDGAIFRSDDRGATFERLELGWEWEHQPLRELAVTPFGLVAATMRTVTDGTAGVYVSRDGGESWQQAESPLLAAGALTVEEVGGRLFAALTEGGVACSHDGGLTWASRCPG